MLCFGCGLDDGGGCCRSWDPSTNEMLPSSLSTLTYEAERTLDSPTRSRQGLPLVVNDLVVDFSEEMKEGIGVVKAMGEGYAAPVSLEGNTVVRWQSVSRVRVSRGGTLC